MTDQERQELAVDVTAMLALRNPAPDSRRMLEGVLDLIADVERLQQHPLHVFDASLARETFDAALTRAERAEAEVARLQHGDPMTEIAPYRDGDGNIAAAYERAFRDRDRCAKEQPIALRRVLMAIALAAPGQEIVVPDWALDIADDATWTVHNWRNERDRTTIVRVKRTGTETP